MTDEAKALVERCKGHTPGPWRWEVNRSHKSVKLCGGPPKHGFGRYDLTVMDFSRYGMNKAAPVFWNWREGPFLVGDPKRADELAVEVQGREHHANWFADIDHPDAQLVAAAPELLDLIETQAREIERLRKLTCATWFYMPDEGDRCWFSPHEVIDEMYDPEPGNHVFEVECATSLPSIWCAVRVTNDPDADERFTFTEHATEAEARAALAGEQ